MCIHTYDNKAADSYDIRCVRYINWYLCHWSMRWVLNYEEVLAAQEMSSDSHVMVDIRWTVL